jgi:Carboxypeptidase regulatory-like domain
LLGWAGSSTAAVRIIVGPTPIPGGQANAAHDLTLVNEKLAASIAVDTSPPWAIPKGALIDAAPVVRGAIQRDRIAFADFLPNGWSAWPNTYQHVQVLTDTPALAAVRATRDWNAVQIVTTYSLGAGDDSIHIVVTMTNGGTTPVTDALSGLVLWAQGGYFFGVPGLPHQMSGSAEGAKADRIVAYDQDWLIALHEPVFDRFSYGQRDLYLKHTLGSGQSRTFEGWLQIVGRGDMAPVVNSEIRLRKLSHGAVAGVVRAAGGAPLKAPVVVVEKDGVPYAWTLGSHGHYALELPAGRYELYATSEGYSESAHVLVSVGANENLRQDFTGLMPPGGLRVSISDQDTGAPVDARLDIKTGQKPVVEYLGKHVFFTDLRFKGNTQINLAPGPYVLSIGSGGGFTSEPREVSVTVVSGEVQSLAVAVQRLFNPEKDGWYSADLHHHSDQEDGVSPPTELARSELAAGLDVLFISDHDSTVNHKVLQGIADERGVPFIPSIELSPSWGHFNAYPIKPGTAMNLEMNKATVQDVFAEAHRMGAEFIEVNHPYNPGEGYFASLDRGVASGGFDPDFDFLEINGAESDKDEKTLAAAWKFWGDGKRYYLAAGSDTHDVWNSHSGAARVYVHVDGPLTAAKFLEGLKRGHAFVSHGPLVFADPLFGETAILKGGRAALTFRLQAVAGLKRATVICQGQPVKAVDFRNGETIANLDFVATEPGFCALTAEDALGKTAYTNPIWVEAPR